MAAIDVNEVVEYLVSVCVVRGTLQLVKEKDEGSADFFCE
jgi:hypothetical protein